MSGYGFFQDNVGHDDSAEREVNRLQARLAAVTAERDWLRREMDEILDRGVETLRAVQAERDALAALLGDVHEVLEVEMPNAEITARVEAAMREQRQEAE